MSIVRQSITALYQEAERNAADGSPMLAVIQGTRSPHAGDVPVSQISGQISGQRQGQATAMSALATAPSVKEPAAIVARFDELKRLAEEEALQASPLLEPVEASDAELIAAIQTEESDQSSDLTTDETIQGHSDFNDLVETEEAVAADLSLPDLSTSLPAFGDTAPITNIPAAEDNSTGVTGEDSIAAQNIPPSDPDVAGTTALPAEPPTPEAGTADDLDIADIHSLVQQAWEDETAIAGAATSSSVGKSDGQAEDPSSQAMATAMDEIAAAVEQSSGPAIPELSEAVKAQLTATIRSELHADLSASLREELRTEIRTEIKTGLQQEVETSLKGFLITDLPAMVKAAVAEAVADAMPSPVDNQPVTADTPALKKAAPKSATKKRAAAKKTAAPRTTKKKSPPDLG